MAHAVDLFVDRGIFFDVSVGARDVGFGLVVVVIRDEIFDGVVGKEVLELAVELRRQCLVGRENQRRPLCLFDHFGHGEGLARAGDAEQHLRAVVPPHALDQFGNRLRLVALGIEIRLDDERAAAFRFLRPGRPMRRPRLLVKFGPALAQQALERVHRRADAERDRLQRWPVALFAPRLGNVGNFIAVLDRGLVVSRADQRLRGIGAAIAERGGQFRIDVGGAFRGVAALRPLGKRLLGGSSRPVRIGKIGAAVPRIVGRRRELGCLLFPFLLWRGVRGARRGREAT